MFTANAFKEFCELAIRSSDELKALPVRLIDALIRKALNQEIEDPALAEGAASIYRNYRDYTRQEILTAGVCAYLAERRMTDDDRGVRNAQLRRDIRQELSAMNKQQHDWLSETEFQKHVSQLRKWTIERARQKTSENIRRGNSADEPTSLAKQLAMKRKRLSAKKWSSRKDIQKILTEALVSQRLVEQLRAYNLIADGDPHAPMMVDFTGFEEQLIIWSLLHLADAPGLHVHAIVPPGSSPSFAMHAKSVFEERAKLIAAERNVPKVTRIVVGPVRDKDVVKLLQYQKERANVNVRAIDAKAFEACFKKHGSIFSQPDIVFADQGGDDSRSVVYFTRTINVHMRVADGCAFCQPAHVSKARELFDELECHLRDFEFPRNRKRAKRG